MRDTLPAQIEVDDLEKMLKNDETVEILDVREPWEVQVCALTGSIHVPLRQLPESLDRLSPEKPLVVLCHHGMRSLQAVMWLRRNGFDRAMNLAGGIDAWANRIDPSMPRY
jgi:rhodanese-related sulfurtransferase